MSFFQNNKLLKIALLLLCLLVVIFVAVYYTLPVNRVSYSSELIMLGDLNNDNKWDESDATILTDFVSNPFSYNPLDSLKIDINKNGRIDEEDIIFLTALYKYSDPYKTADKFFNETDDIFPRPRELFRYLPTTEYIQRPLFSLDHKIIESSPLQDILTSIKRSGLNYSDELTAEIYNEAIRFSLAFDLRKNNLNEMEQAYANDKISYCKSLYEKNDLYNLLLNLISITEDAETLTTQNQSKFVQQTLYFRDDLRKLLTSPLYTDFTQNKIGHAEIFAEIEKHITEEFGTKIKLAELKPPRDLTNLDNYVDRIEWQYNKTSTKNEAFRKIMLYAQYDKRYLRAVSKTNQKYSDPELMNHNLPMILLYRNALEIQNGDKKAAVGMLDEAIRIPLGWVKSIPKDKLPSSIALENFLLPGNKEDGADKSRHWNVFGGISLYKSPEESFTIALQREISDLKEADYSNEAMTEFIRDTIANLNGIYYIMSINPDLNRGLTNRQK